MKKKPRDIIVIENVRKCSLCGQDVQFTADKEPFCQKCGWIEPKTHTKRNNQETCMAG